MDISAVSIQGVQHAQVQFQGAVVRVIEASASADLVSLSESMVQLLAARTQVEASIAVARTVDEIQRKSLDVLA